MRNVLYGIVQDQNLDICAVSETWLAVDTSEKLMGKVFGSDFVWFDRERKHQKGTFGGVGLLCRKSVGVFSLIKVSNQYEILWVKLCRNNDLYFFCSVYIPPTKSRREDAKEVLIELETDIINFRRLGKVIVMGDFNCRIGGTDSSMVVGGKQFSFSRSTQDMVKGGDANKGAHLVASMNAVQMVVMNGIDSGGEFTFRNSKKGASVIDYIILSDNIVIPDSGSVDNGNTTDQE